MEKIFVEGLISKKVGEKAPDWILGSLSINVQSLTNWLNTTGQKVQKDGWINMDIKKSKEGKRYIEVNTYNPNMHAVVPERKVEPAHVVPTVKVEALKETGIDYGEVINPDDIPF